MRKYIASMTDRGKHAPSRYCLWPAVTLILVSSVSFAQVERATITGTMTDKNGAVVPDAAVRVTEESTNETKVLQSDSAGAYTVSNLTPGSYTIEVEKTGFTKHINKGYEVQVGQTARLDVVMDARQTSADVSPSSPSRHVGNSLPGPKHFVILVPV